MLTTTGTHTAVRFSILAVLIALTAVLPDQLLVHAKRVWSYLVYCIGYRLLSIQPFVIILFTYVVCVSGRVA
jgi:hypothetical protein